MTADIAALVGDSLDVWTTAIERKAGVGRGGGKRIDLYGVGRLRTLIRDLAICGKLVPQNPEDEPATQLLKRFTSARSLVDKCTTQADKAGSGVMPALPQGWASVRLDELCNSQAGFAFKSGGFNEQGMGLPLIRIRDVGQQFTGTYYSGEYREDFVVVRGDYLISMDGEFRVAAWQGDNALLNQRVSRLQFYSEEIEPQFVAIALQTELSKLQGVKAYTTVDHLSGKQIAETRIALPPLVEQQRIIAKMSELMTLCGALEEESAEAMAAHEALVEALLATLTASSDATSLAANWARLDAHFDTLFTTEASVDALKRAVLQLAVRGKLSRQNASDEPASELLRAIKSQMAELTRPGRARTPPPTAPIRDGDVPFAIPEGWRFARFSDVLINRDFERVPISSEDRAQRKGPFDYYGASGIIDHIDDYIFEEPLLLVGEDGANLVNRSTPIAFIADGKYWVNNHAHVLQAISQPFLRFMEIFINAIDLKPYVTGTAQPKMNQAKMGSIVVAVPPADELERIAAKVDELNGLCDVLRLRIDESAETQRRLADAVVERATA